MSTIEQRQDAPGFDNPFEIKENQRRYMSVDQSIIDSVHPVYIFSVDPMPHLVSKGGLGEFLIQGSGEERVSEPLVIKGMHPEHMHLGSEVSPVNYIPGVELAKDIVGVNSADKGLGRHTSNLEWHGVFITHNAKPKKEEIEAAEAKRKQYLERLVSDADQKAMRGKTGDIDATERAAAHELNLKKAWAEKPTAMESCPACGSAVRPGIAVCPNCTAILNEEQARKFFPERFAKPEPKPEPVTPKRA